MKQIYIKKSMLRDKDISDSAFLIIAALQPYSNSKNDLLITTEFLCYLIYNREVTKTESTYISNGLKELIDKNIIVLKQMITKNQYVCDVTGLFINKGDFFVTVSYDEMRNILSIDSKTDKPKLFRYFCCIVSCFNYSKNLEERYRGKICGVSIDTITDLPIRTAIRYNEILEDNKFIFIFRYEDVLRNNDRFVKIPNTYSRYEDMELCKDYAVYYQSQYGWNHMQETKSLTLLNANKNRALGQKYVQLCKGKKYDKETIKDIYNWVIEWNSNPEHSNCQKDLSVFEEIKKEN